MGWAFRDLTVHDDEHDDDGVDRVHRDHKRREHAHTAHDVRVPIPVGFVGPSVHNSKPKTVPSHNHRPQNHTLKKQKKLPVRSRRTTPSRSPSPRNTTTKVCVDFVYDVDVRRALRERMDAERLEILRLTKAKETKLRADHKWVNDSGRKQAWSAASGGTPSAKKPPSKPRVVSTKTAIAPNVFEWRTQEMPFHSSPEIQRQQRNHRQQLSNQKTQRDTQEVTHSLDAFERQWCSGA